MLDPTCKIANENLTGQQMHLSKINYIIPKYKSCIETSRHRNKLYEKKEFCGEF